MQGSVFAKLTNWRFRFNGGPVDPKFQVEGVAPTNHSSAQKTRLSDLLYGIKIWTHHSFILSQSTRLTDGQTEFSLLDHICIPCSAVIIVAIRIMLTIIVLVVIVMILIAVRLVTVFMVLSSCQSLIVFSLNHLQWHDVFFDSKCEWLIQLLTAKD